MTKENILKTTEIIFVNDRISSSCNINNNYRYCCKDNLCSLDFGTTASTNFLNNFWSGYDSFVINQLKKKGYSLLGKVILDELSCGGTGLLANSGAVYNPFDKKHIVGGSSSGSALAVKKNLVAFSLASDTGGSIRVPAAYCGLLGLKPSFGIFSRLGLIPYCSLLDTIGIISNTIDSLEKVLLDLTTVDNNDLWTTLAIKKKIITNKNPIKIFLIKGIDKYLHQKYLDIYFYFVEKLKEKYEVLEVVIPSFIKKNILMGWISICFSELVSHLNSFQGITFGTKDINKTIKQLRTIYLSNTVKNRLLIGSYILKKGIKRGMLRVYSWRQRLETWMNSLFRKNSFLIFPTTLTEAPLVEEEASFLSLGGNEHWSSNLILLSNLSRTPSISIPIGSINNLPVGICINAGWGKENELIKLAKQVLHFLEN